MKNERLEAVLPFFYNRFNQEATIGRKVALNIYPGT
jgi:hypothetical protein